MKFEQFYSGSSGNLYVVTASNGNRLIIDPGVRWTRLQKALNFDLQGITACFVSHEHKDHSKAVRDVLKAGINVYMSNVTICFLDLERERRIKPIANKTLVRLDDFDVYCFDVHHDAQQPMGFVIRADDEFLLFATDTSHITQQFKYQFSIIAIECSYSKEILQHRVDTNDINETLAKRLLTSHIEKKETMRYIEKFCNLSKCREIHLLHMSADNIDKEQTRKEFEKRFFITTIIK